MEECVEDEPPNKTPFFRARKMERVLNFKRLFVKYEGGGVTGTQKDRISKYHVMRARELGYDTVSLGSCGNYGASLAYFAGEYGMNSIIGVPSSYSGDRLSEIRSYGGSLLELPMKYEEVVEYMRQKATDENWYDSNPGNSNSELDFQGYSQIASEIVSQLGRTPEFISAPVGNGTTLTGIYKGFRLLRDAGLIDSVPRLIAASTDGGNPVVRSWRKGHRKIQNLGPLDIRETSINEPLVSYVSFDGQAALDSIYESNGFAFEVPDTEMMRYSQLLMVHENVDALPASSSAVVAANRVAQMLNRKIDCVVIITGKGKNWKMQ
ncbi:MAG: pyridoxal-phosphate dependent enzyme [Thermoplasmata archaeon]